MTDIKESAQVPVAREWLSTLREILVIAGLLIGGGWSIYRYVYLESATAKLEYEQKLERLKGKIKFNAKLNLKISNLKDGYLIYGDYVVENTGDVDAVFVTNDPDNLPVSIYMLNDDAKPQKIPPAKVIYNYIYDEDGEILEAASVDAGRKTSIPFAIKVKEQGLYVINVRFPVSSSDLSEFEKSKGENDWFWSEQKIISIP